MHETRSSTAQTFCVSSLSDGREVVVAVHGELDLASAEVLESEVRKLRGAGFDGLVIDLCDVDFIDSAGLRLLIGLRNTAKRDGHRLSIVPGPSQVQRIFDLTATQGLFDWRA